ncbi:hypothetical protein DZF93_06350, partial [Clavibacter michiganensis subsp. insidiosus]
MSGRRSATVLLAVAALAVVGGAVALIRSLAQPVTFFSGGYAPLSGETFTTPAGARGVLAGAVLGGTRRRQRPVALLAPRRAVREGRVDGVAPDHREG